MNASSWLTAALRRSRPREAWAASNLLVSAFFSPFPRLVAWTCSISCAMVKPSTDPLTVTVNEHVPVLPDPSVAVQFTLVTPSGKLDPEAGAHLAVTLPQLSLAVGCG